jgi:hypothetical protein
MNRNEAMIGNLHNEHKRKHFSVGDRVKLLRQVCDTVPKGSIVTVKRITQDHAFEFLYLYDYRGSWRHPAKSARHNSTRRAKNRVFRIPKILHRKAPSRRSAICRNDDSTRVP